MLDCDLSHKDKYLVSGSMDCTVRLWAVETGKCLRVYHGEPASFVLLRPLTIDAFLLVLTLCR